MQQHLTSSGRLAGGLVALAAVCASGCATVVSGRHAQVSLASNPPGAHVTVQNDTGETVATAHTPASVSLKRNKGIFRGGAHYTATFDKPGYRSESVAIDPKLNPWTVGNLVLGGPVGLVADGATGAIWRYAPDRIEPTLVPESAPLEGPALGGGQIVPTSLETDVAL